jgi:hypothetical protein
MFPFYRSFDKDKDGFRVIEMEKLAIPLFVNTNFIIILITPPAEHHHSLSRKKENVTVLPMIR